jgi:hypothetical protein
VREQRSLSTVFDYFALLVTNWRLDRGSGRNGKELDNGQAWKQCSLLDYDLFLYSWVVFGAWRRKTTKTITIRTITPISVVVIAEMTALEDDNVVIMSTMTPITGPVLLVVILPFNHALK